MKTLLVFFSLSFLWVASASALQFFESFSSNSRKDATLTTGVWNISLGVLHPTLFVNDWEHLAGPQDTAFDVGDGSHGAFVRSRYSQFSSSLSGNVILLDTDIYPELKVTTFTLDEGWTLRPQGSNPLIIRSLKDVIVSGVIDCAGSDGEDLNTDNTQTTLGGIARCGGGQGGNGGSTLVVPTDGSDGGASVTGGSFGAVGDAGGGYGGGGGGGYRGSITFPTAGAGGGGGAAGTFFGNDDFTEIGGGSGGGGGSAFDDVGDVPNHSSGAGGGAGGGVIFIRAVRDMIVGVSGAIRADGGDGGGDAGTFRGGAGGGGAGGSISAFVGRDIVFNGPLTANLGVAGTSSGRNGGIGGTGRTWVAEKDAFAAGIPEKPDSLLVGSRGRIQYETTAQQFTSKVIDLKTQGPDYQSISIASFLPGTSTATLEVAGSSDGFVNDVGGFKSGGQIKNLSGLRYFKFQVTLTNSEINDPATVRSLTFLGHQQDDYDFVAACGSIGKSAATRNLSWSWLILFLPMLFLALFRKRLIVHF